MKVSIFFPSVIRYCAALGKKIETFKYGDSTYYFVSEGEDTYRILQLAPVAEELVGKYRSLIGGSVSPKLIDAYKSAVDKGLNSFEMDGISYRITKSNKVSKISTEHDVALAMINVYDAYNESDSQTVSSYDFKLASSRALAQNKAAFSVGDQTYTIKNDEGQFTILDSARYGICRGIEHHRQSPRPDVIPPSGF